MQRVHRVVPSPPPTASQPVLEAPAGPFASAFAAARRTACPRAAQRANGGFPPVGLGVPMAQCMAAGATAVHSYGVTQYWYGASGPVPIKRCTRRKAQQTPAEAGGAGGWRGAAERGGLSSAVLRGACGSARVPLRCETSDAPGSWAPAPPRCPNRCKELCTHNRRTHKQVGEQHATHWQGPPAH